ncbi:PREDICTED: testis-expressed sequence 10 protein homolog isoform X2 [Cyphomyrmex costatus]|uniref:testis-expressed sequence 10 protein homolog isoform X2 n=1 Tax=Cyphomyrmex costatus TaxID=456900 RepID=UPI000852323F|nr:PREDICTED: testis-expressed sequence 10 protein homolog isoform X2 [Cyphomyrmex costatus]
MSKNHKRLKRLKSEKAKVKLKGKTVHQLPKGLNITNTSFKVKQILIREQLKQRDETEILSTRKLNIDDLLTRFRHHNSTVRQDALKQLKDILLQNPVKSLHSRLNSLLHGIAALSLDKEREIRRNSFHALNFILGLIPNEQLTPLRETIISFLCCAMTHIDPRVKEDSLLFLDVLVQNCSSALAKDSHKILPNFLGMICRLHKEGSPAAQLTTTLDSKSTNVKWRIKVLERLANLFTSIVNYRKLCIGTRSIVTPFVRTKKCTRYIPIYGNSASQFCEIILDQDMISIDNHEKENLPVEEFVKCTHLLMPVMADIWLELCPDEEVESYAEITILNEAAALLKSIIVIIQSIVEYMDTLDQDDYGVKRMKYWFKDTFHNAYMKNFLSRFPYEECLEQNLGLCQIHVWFTSLFNCNEQFPKSVRTYCVSILKYLNGTIETWCDSSTLPQLTKLLRTLFLKAGPIWYNNHINLNHTLRLIIQASSRLPKNELQSQLYVIIGDIMLNSNLNELHREKIFESFVTFLPSLLLRPSIDDVVIRMIGQIVLRFKEWIQEELIAKHESIIENVKKIDIVGTYDDKQSRLMIYNLFYFVDSQIYY